MQFLKRLSTSIVEMVSGLFFKEGLGFTIFVIFLILAGALVAQLFGAFSGDQAKSCALILTLLDAIPLNMKNLSVLLIALLFCLAIFLICSRAHTWIGSRSERIIRIMDFVSGMNAVLMVVFLLGYFIPLPSFLCFEKSKSSEVTLVLSVAIFWAMLRVGFDVIIKLFSEQVRESAQHSVARVIRWPLALLATLMAIGVYFYLITYDLSVQVSFTRNQYLRLASDAEDKGTTPAELAKRLILDHYHGAARSGP